MPPPSAAKKSVAPVSAVAMKPALDKSDEEDEEPKGILGGMFAK